MVNKVVYIYDKCGLCDNAPADDERSIGLSLITYYAFMAVQFI